MIHRLKQITIVIGDVVMFYLAFYLSIWLRYLQIPKNFRIHELFSPMTDLFIMAVIIFFIAGLYDIERSKNRWPFFQKILIVLTFWMFLGLIYFYLNSKITAQPKTIMLLCATLSFALISLWRAIHNKYILKAILKTKIVFIGLTEAVSDLMEKIDNEPELGYEIIGIVKIENQPSQERLPIFCNYKILSDINELDAQNIQPDAIVIAPALAQDPEMLKNLYGRLFKQTGIFTLEKFYELIMKRIPPFTFSESWFLQNLKEQEKKIYDRFRMIIDFFFAFIMAIFFAVTFLFIALMIKLSSSGPIFFSQKRVGQNGKIFSIYKFRTMKVLNSDGSAELNGAQYAQIKDSRITGVGKFLRRSRLDELPQFLNILKREMSLIGPRPERPEFVEQLTTKMPYYALRHLIKPGLTGWAQIQKSYYGNIEENLRKLEYDLYYLKNRNLLLDISIILRTFNILGRMAGR
jgi:exopolysaccharide biosynthesis polyprenyl glycosylphosphotransferase